MKLNDDCSRVDVKGSRRFPLSLTGSTMLLFGSCMALPASAAAETVIAPVDYNLAAPTNLMASGVAGETQFAALSTGDLVQSEIDAIEGERQALEPDPLRLSFGDHLRSVRTELFLAVGYMTAVNLAKYVDRGNLSGFKFTNEGLFEKDTRELGVDKLVHAHNSYMLSELFAARIRKKTGTTKGTALSGALIGSGLMLYSEIYDGFKSGFGAHDLAFNTLGAAFSVLRETTPGLEEKLDFRMLIIPDDNIYSPTGLKHYRQLRYLFALELAGFERLRDTPLRFVELHAGYYAKGFTEKEKARGDPLERKLFAGVGLNLNQLLFGKSPRSRAARAASQVLDYWQPPYTYLHVD